MLKKILLGVRVSVKSGGCAGMSYVMEYSKELNPSDENIEDKGVKVYIDPSAIIYLSEQKWIIKKMIFHHLLYSITLMKQSVVAVESL